MALVNEIEAEQLEKLKKITDRLYELVRRKKYVDMEIKIVGGDITIWMETSKHKP